MPRLKINAIVEVGGFPKEHIEEAMKNIVDKTKELKGTKILKADTAETKQHEKMFSTFTEFEIEFTDFESLLIFAFNFMPSSLEIIEPIDIHLKLEEMQTLFDVLLEKLHQYDMGVKKLLLENRALRNQLQPKEKE